MPRLREALHDFRALRAAGRTARSLHAHDRHRGDDRARIHSAGKKGAERNVRDQAHAHGFIQQSAQLFQIVILAPAHSFTLEAGAGLCDEAAVRTIVMEGPTRVRELVELGLHFDLTVPAARYVRGYFVAIRM